jgi:YesN/AraC family two-component response regulator
MKKLSTKVHPSDEFMAAYGKLHKDSIGDDFIMVDDISSVPFFDFPHKTEVVIATICLKGTIEGTINLKNRSFSENNLLVILDGQIVQYSNASPDFSALFVIMSKRFAENLGLILKDSLSISIHLKDNPVISLNPEEMELLLDYYSVLKKTVRMKENPNRLAMINLMLQAFFLGANDFHHYRDMDATQKPRKEVLFESFYDMVLKHHKESREVVFYAEKLCITPKYLSALIKQTTGRSAVEWINDYVILEAKSMLKSTNMSIQEIGYNLGFPNPSFFAKFFKQHAGISPKEYR